LNVAAATVSPKRLVPTELVSMAVSAAAFDVVAKEYPNE
jgi:hypothetical protein